MRLPDRSHRKEVFKTLLRVWHNQPPHPQKRETHRRDLDFGMFDTYSPFYLIGFVFGEILGFLRIAHPLIQRILVILQSD